MKESSLVLWYECDWTFSLATPYIPVLYFRFVDLILLDFKFENLYILRSNQYKTVKTQVKTRIFQSDQENVISLKSSFDQLYENFQQRLEYTISTSELVTIVRVDKTQKLHRHFFIISEPFQISNTI